MSVWSNKVGWIVPWLISALMAGPRSAVIQSSSAGLRSSRMRALASTPPVADDRHMGQAEPLLQLRDLEPRSGGVAGGALEHFDCHRDLGGSGEHPVDDLQPGRAPHHGRARSRPAGRSAPRTRRTTRHKAPASRRPGAGRPARSRSLPGGAAASPSPHTGRPRRTSPGPAPRPASWPRSLRAAPGHAGLRGTVGRSWPPGLTIPSTFGSVQPGAPGKESHLSSRHGSPIHGLRQKHRNAACVKSGGCSAVSSCSA